MGDKKDGLYPKGIEAMRKHLGDALTEEQIERFSKVSPTLAEALAVNFGLFYTPENCVLDQKTKELCVVSVLTSKGNMPQLKTHIQGALRCGATKEEVIEAVVQTIPYSGFPFVLTAVEILQEL